MATLRKDKAEIESTSPETDSNIVPESLDASPETAPNLNNDDIKEVKSTTDVQNDQIKVEQESETDELDTMNLDDEKSDNLETDVLEKEATTDKNEDETLVVNESINNGVTVGKTGIKLHKGRKRKANDTHLNNESSGQSDQEKKQKTDDIEPPILIAQVKDEPVFNEADLDLPPKQTFGKGKRARIPNKRYSDITLSNKSLSKSFENGSEKIESENEIIEMSIKEEPLSPAVSTKSKDNADTPVSTKKKTVDLSDPKYLKPFKYGWRRELVWRGTVDSNNKRNGDIYYYSPQGKKVRSMREVSENLKSKDLTLENFTYFKASLGLNDPEKETVRSAKKPNNQIQLKTALAKSSPRSPKLPATSSATNKISSPKPSTSKVLSPKIASPKISSPQVSSPKSSSPKLVSQKITNANITSPKLSNTRGAKAKLSTSKTSSPKIQSPKQPISEPVEPSMKTRASGKTPVKTKVPPKKDKRASKSEEIMEVDTPPPLVSKPAPPKKGRWANFNEGDKPCQPCSIRCEGVHGLVPTLQCRICLCLYHHECVGIAPHLSVLYVCKNCQLENQGEKPSESPTLVAPPPLTPINTFKSAGVQSTSVLPKLQRIPRPDDPTFLTETDLHLDEFSEMPRLIPRPDPIHEIQKSVTPPLPPTVNESKSIVGSVTTWLPHNSKIVDNIQQNCEEPTEVPRPQYVEFLAGRKFLVIPKHNFMSVSPSLAASAITKAPTTRMPDNLQINSPSVILENAVPGADPVTKPTSESPSKPENSQTPEAMEIDDTNELVAIMEADGKSGGNGKVLDINSEASPVPAKPKKRTIKLSSITNSEEKEENKFMDNYLQNLSYGYNTLLYVFQYLKVQDLLRAGCVCTMWRDIASHPMLWRTVRMKNSQVHSFEGLANSLKKHDTRHLDLRKMLLPTGGDEIWPEFSRAIEKVDTLRKIELCRCPASVVEKLAISNPQLDVINAVTIKCESMDLESLKALTNIRELRLKSTGGLTLTSNLDSLRDMKELKHLSLTSIRDLDRMNLNVIAELTNLESLDLGECTDFPKSFGSEILVKLYKLEKLRLEKGQGLCHTFDILDAIKDMNRLEQLELVNFDIKAGFDKALGVCQNIKKLLIIPTYISQSATTNHMVLGGVLRLQRTLSHFVWGVTLELLRVTELFVDQCEEPEKKEKREKKAAGNGDSIPVLKPVPLLIDKDSEIPPAHDPPQVEILALPSLQKLLMQNLPTTRVKILKIPFHATWRQSITDSVN